MSRPFERCANGCDAPPCPPSRVICRACMDRITRTLEAAVAGMNVRSAEREERGKEKEREAHIAEISTRETLNDD